MVSNFTVIFQRMVNMAAIRAKLNFDKKISTLTFGSLLNMNYFMMFAVIMPPSALELLTRLNIEYPMIFKLTNKKTKRITHCGVLEFVADEGYVYLPHWVCFI